ncbi:Bro-N domain-containing protein [Clostridioides difficile]|nr:Bro-N domain-containing protein [Clostridioides difficile]
MMNNLQIFKNNDFGEIRTIGIDNEVWFVGKDVAEKLGYKDTSDALKRHIDDEDKRVGEIPTPRGKQNLIMINESGLYSLILSSKLPTAKKFKNWVTKEVLPSIRKTGSFNINRDNIKDVLIPIMLNGMLAGFEQLSIENDKKIDTRFNQIENKLDKKYKKQDKQFQNMKEMIGFKTKNTMMLSKLLKAKLSEIEGHDINAYNYTYRTAVTRLFSKYNVTKWEDIPVTKFNEVHAMIDGIESMEDVYTWTH